LWQLGNSQVLGTENRRDKNGGLAIFRLKAMSLGRISEELRLGEIGAPSPGSYRSTGLKAEHGAALCGNSRFALVIVSKLASRPRSIAPAMRLSLSRPECHEHWLWPWMKFTHLWFIASGTTGILSKESRGAFCRSNSAVTREPNQAVSPHRAEKHGSCAKQFRARASRDITVPMGSPQISAISR